MTMYGIFRFGLNGLGELLQGRAEIALSVVTNQVQKLFDYTPDAKDLVCWFLPHGRPPGDARGRPATRRRFRHRQGIEGSRSAASDHPGADGGR